MGGLEEGCKKLYSQQVGYIIKLAHAVWKTGDRVGIIHRYTVWRIFERVWVV